MISATARDHAVQIISQIAGDMDTNRVLGASRAIEVHRVRVDVAARLRGEGWSCVLIAALFNRNLGAVAHWLRLAQQKAREPKCRELGLTPWRRTRATERARKQRLEQQQEAHAEA